MRARMSSSPADADIAVSAVAAARSKSPAAARAAARTSRTVASRPSVSFAARSANKTASEGTCTAGCGAVAKIHASPAKAAAQSGKTNTPVSGLGTEAHYWVSDSDNGLWALNGSVSVDVTAYFLSPMPTADQLQPLVAKVLSEIK